MKHPHLLLRILPIAGIVLSAAACTPSSEADTTGRDDDGEVVEAGQVGVFALREGDCVRLPSSLLGAATDDVEVIENFPAVPCDEPHDGEVVLDDDDFFADVEEFPGESAAIDQGNPRCIEALDAYTGTTFETSNFSVTALVPSAESWDLLDDRGLKCLGVTLDDSLTNVIDTTTSMRAGG